MENQPFFLMGVYFSLPEKIVRLQYMLIVASRKLSVVIKGY